MNVVYPSRLELRSLRLSATIEFRDAKAASTRSPPHGPALRGAQLNSHWQNGVSVSSERVIEVGGHQWSHPVEPGITVQ
ncbi:hypothetical protein AALO_G00134820 [Alosa alosa]|uniref:Uncharacterized protein n=1 Tax=Alosa alosa TaxID=278164 RepID=A0AAV6GK09_9TELE|nr:hypothetical protein AALO_G00134820 [Alosa alosa]